MATHKSLKITLWTRTWDLLKGVLLYGTINWKRASDELKPPRLSPRDRKMAMPSKSLEVIKPRQNPQAALIKTSPLMQEQRNLRDITAGAIVSDPSLEHTEPQPSSPLLRTPSAMSEPMPMESSPSREDLVVVRRRRRSRHGVPVKRAPRSAVHYPESGKPGLFARLFGSR